jgi:hypothetical protein
MKEDDAYFLDYLILGFWVNQNKPNEKLVL